MTAPIAERARVPRSRPVPPSPAPSPGDSRPPVAPTPATRPRTGRQRAGRERAGFRDVLGVGGFRTLLVADLLSLLGDQLAAVALGYLLFERTGSPFLAAAGYAVTWLPALLGGPVLAALADRLPPRAVMVGSDLGRAGLVALAALPGLPPAGLAALVLGAGMLAPPHEAARAGVQVQLLTGARLAVGNALRNTVHQASLLFGLGAGGAVVLLVGPSGALLLDAGTFLASAMLLRLGLAAFPAATAEPDGGGGAEPVGGPGSGAGAAADDRPSVRSELLAGYRAVAAEPRLAWPLTLGAVGAAAGVVPEALAPAYAAALSGGSGGSAGLGLGGLGMGGLGLGGWAPAEPVVVGLVMAAGAAGSVVGGLLLTRLARDGGHRLVWPLAVAGMLPLVAVAAEPGLAVSLLLFALAGAAGSFQVVAQAMFAAAAPAPVRGRVFGLAMAVIAGVQALAAGVAGALAELVEPSLVIAAAGAAGVTFLLCLRPLSPQTGHRPAGRPIRRRAGLPLPAARHRA